MNFKNNIALRDQLAGEYVLGTLRGGARRRFEQMCRVDRELQQRVDWWADQIAPLMELVPAVTPSDRVWRKLTSRIPELADRKAAGKAGFWSSLALWRGAAGAMAVVAAVAIGMMATRPGIAPEQVATVAPATLLATFSAPDTHAPIAVAMMGASPGEVIVKVVAPDLNVPNDKTLQLWLIRPGSDAMVSVGVAPRGGMTTLKIKVGDVGALSGAKTLGLSLEPLGGSPQPTHALGFGVWSKVST